MTLRQRNNYRDIALIIVILLCASIMFTPGMAYGADTDVQTWYQTINWTNIIVTLLGGGGVFGAVKYFLDYKLGTKQQSLEEKKVDNAEAAKLREELNEIIDRMQAEINGLRRRVYLLENCLSKNNIPIPFHSEPGASS